MFKKIEIWILYLTILFSILFAVGFGVLVRQELVGSIKAGWVSKTALTLAEIPVNIKSILKFGDLVVEDRFPNLDGFNGTPNSDETYLLHSRYDGDLQEGVVELVDLRNFEILHTWNPDIDAFNDLVEQVNEFAYLDRDKNNKRSRLVHPKLTSDGGLLFQNDTPLRKIDACSNLVFQNTHDSFHHSIETDIDGNIWVPSHIYPQSLPIEKVGRGHIGQGGFLDDAIVKLSPEGDVLFEKSLSQIFIDNGLEYLLFSVGDGVFDFDPIHLNDIQPVNFDGEFWKKGDVFLSLRHQSMVLLYRPSTNEIIWKGTGTFFHQHDVDILDNHRISIFNNNSKDFVDGDVVDGHNEVIIYNFKTNEYSSYLKDSLIENDVRTPTQGRSQILPNGDLFIEETDYARTLYFNADGSLRWTHVNRAENGNVYSVGWSRILYTKEDIQTVNNFLTNRETCNE
ncbi:arylsulfotransferase family protein [Gammaproteobacteria bacterium]|nr:arylsulfotransferase family protein [Gammaproteobacteria bacterium]